MTNVMYCDTSDIHGTWWRAIRGSLPITVDKVNSYFMTHNLDFTSKLQSGEKYFVIIHTGETSFKAKINLMDDWITVWNNNYNAYANQICVVFVSGGKLQVDDNVAKLASHHKYPVYLIPTNKQRVLDDIVSAIKNLNDGTKIDFTQDSSADYLIPLSILCISYLAEHGQLKKNKIITDIITNKSTVKRTEDKSKIWKKVLGDKLEAVDPRLIVDPKIAKLINAIYARDKILDVTVKDAYTAITTKFKKNNRCSK